MVSLSSLIGSPLGSLLFINFHILVFLLLYSSFLVLARLHLLHLEALLIGHRVRSVFLGGLSSPLLSLDKISVVEHEV